MLATAERQPRTEIVWAPQPGPQAALMTCPLPLIFFGGARGGGKTDGVLGKWAAKERRYGSGFNAIMFRRTTVSSEDAIERSKQLYTPLGGTYNESKSLWRMPNGGRVGFRYLDSIRDAEEWQGRNLTDAWIEEAGQYAEPTPIDRLFGVLRSSRGVPVQMILTANPGGAGQHWLSERFGLHPLPSRAVMRRVKINEGEIDAAVIPSRLQDNPILTSADPGYVSRLQLVGSASLVRAWLDGDWSAVEGAFFDCWSTVRHVVEPFTVPASWPRFRSGDWGSASPFSFGWWAVVSDDHRLPDGRILPRGCLVRYREWYGMKPGQPNVGLKLHAEAVGQGIAEREVGETVPIGVLDPSAFKEDGGPSIASRIMAGSGNKVVFRPADNTRVAGRGAMGGWDQVRARLVGDAEGRAMMVVFSTCRDTIRTLPVLQHDPLRPEDLDTDTEDHAADDVRYACMSRPWVAPARPATPPKRDRWDREPEDERSWKTI